MQRPTIHLNSEGPVTGASFVVVGHRFAVTLAQRSTSHPEFRCMQSNLLGAIDQRDNRNLGRTCSPDSTTKNPIEIPNKHPKNKWWAPTLHPVQINPKWCQTKGAAPTPSRRWMGREGPPGAPSLVSPSACRVPNFQIGGLPFSASVGGTWTGPS